VLNQVQEASETSLAHKVTLTELISGTTYYYVVVATDGSGNTATSDESNFTTTGDPPLPDADGDGLPDSVDSCPNDPNNDIDGDGVCGDVDNCPGVANTGQQDANSNSLGDACDTLSDTDGDGVFDDIEYANGTDPARIGVLPPGYVFPTHMTPLILPPVQGPVDGQRPLPY
jgi:hypothetical protein